jgi:hypothetical protein
MVDGRSSNVYPANQHTLYCPLQTSAWTQQREPVNPAHYGTCGLIVQVYK